MNFLTQSILLIAISLFTGFQLSAQCSNIDSPSSKRSPDTFIGGGQSFGQSIKGACFTGGEITKFSFWSQGNAPTKMHLKIYEGNAQTDAGTPIYSQTDIKLPPANRGGKLTIDLDKPVSIQATKTYSFILTIASSGGGVLFAHVSDNDYEGGQLYLNKNGEGDFYPGHDLRFEVETGASPILECTALGVTIRVAKVKGETIEIMVAKYGASTFTIFPPDTGGTILEFENIASHNLSRADGVGPQAGSSPQTWGVQRADASKPSKIRYKNGSCGGYSLTLLD